VLEALRTRPTSGGDRGIARLEAFSDGVFSIAITLLVLDIRVPQVSNGLAAALAAEWTEYLEYVVSFVIIGIWWANHHELFEHFERSDHTLMLLNTLHLMCIASLPFSTALVAAYLGTRDGDEAVAAAVYAGTLLLAAIGYNLVWRYGARGGLLRGEISESYVQRRNRLGLFSLLTYAVAVALAFESVALSLALCFLIALYYARPSRRPARGLQPASAATSSDAGDAAAASAAPTAASDLDGEPSDGQG